jgi:hypothetical protein
MLAEETTKFLKTWHPNLGEEILGFINFLFLYNLTVEPKNRISWEKR